MCKSCIDNSLRELEILITKPCEAYILNPYHNLQYNILGYNVFYFIK